MANKTPPMDQFKLFEDFKSEILKIDPVYFTERYLKAEGQEIKLSASGWRFQEDIYRYLGVEAIKKTGKPVVIVKGRQVGATTMAAALELYFATSDGFGTSPEHPPMRILHCFPALTLTDKYAKDRLSTMMRTSTDNYVLNHSLNYDEKTGKRKSDLPEDTVKNKIFKNENKIWVDSNGNDAARLVGMSLDAIFYDEAQFMYEDDVGNSRRTLTSARYGARGEGIQFYFGTPRTKGSFFHKTWEASDQRYFHLRCVLCGEYFMLYEPGTDSWERIWLYENILECPHCQHHQDKTEAVDGGKWIPSRARMDNGLEPPYVGFHFNPLLLPNMYKETILKEKPGIHPTNTDRIWKNEILGEFYSGADLPMSEDEIYKHCRNLDRSIATSVPRDPHYFTFAGIDWGLKVEDSSDKRGQSFSSFVIITVDMSGTIQIENAFKLKKNDFEHKKEVVREIYRRYSPELIVSDFMFANDLIPELQKEFGDKFLGCFNSGSLANPYKYEPADLRLVCNPHIVLEELFAWMRKGKVKFPWKSFEHIQWLIQHCCSMEKQVRVVQGQSFNKFVKGSSPNDGLMSLYYCFLAWKFYASKGFSIKGHQQGKKLINVPVLAYLPKMR